MRLVAPVASAVQQLSLLHLGGVVKPAPPLMVVVPDEYWAEVEAVLKNSDVGFVKQCQRAEIKVETFPFTRYGTIPAGGSFISNNVVADEQRGLLFPVRLNLERSTLQVDELTVNLAAGMAVSAEIKSGHRRVIEYSLSPVLQTMGEGFGER